MVYVVTLLEPTAGLDVCEFFTENPAPGIRKLTESEAKELAENRLFYACRLDGKMVATVYFKADTADAWEMGGAIVAEPHRKKALLVCLGAAAIVNQSLAERMSAGAAGQKTILARILKGNPDPENSLERAGFKFSRPIEIDPNKKPGVAAMPKNENGMVVAEEYAFDKTYLVAHAKALLKIRDTRLSPAGAPLEIQIPMLLKDEGDPLAALIEDLAQAAADPAAQ